MEKKLIQPPNRSLVVIVNPFRHLVEYVPNNFTQKYFACWEVAIIKAARAVPRPLVAIARTSGYHSNYLEGFLEFAKSNLGERLAEIPGLDSPPRAFFLKHRQALMLGSAEPISITIFGEIWGAAVLQVGGALREYLDSKKISATIKYEHSLCLKAEELQTITPDYLRPPAQPPRAPRSGFKPTFSP